MFGKVKKYATNKLLEKQLKNAPPQQRQMIMTLMDNNPDLMTKIAKEIKAEVKNGSSEMQASMKVMPKYQAELQKALGSTTKHGGGAHFNPNGTINK